MNTNHNINNGNINLITSTNRSTLGRHKKIILFLQAVIIHKDTAKELNLIQKIKIIIKIIIYIHLKRIKVIKM